MRRLALHNTGAPLWARRSLHVHRTGEPIVRVGPIISFVQPYAGEAYRTGDPVSFELVVDPNDVFVEAVEIWSDHTGSDALLIELENPSGLVWTGTDFTLTAAP